MELPSHMFKLRTFLPMSALIQTSLIMSGGRFHSTSTLSPAASFIIHSQHIDENSIKGTGRHGILTKTDVLKALHEGTAKFVHEPAAVPIATKVSVAASLERSSVFLRNRRMVVGSIGVPSSTAVSVKLTSAVVASNQMSLALRSRRISSQGAK